MNNKAQVFTFSLFIFLLLFAGYIIYSFGAKNQTPVSSLVLTPTPTKKGQLAEPQVTSWTDYNNYKYNFAVSIPEGWNNQEFEKTFKDGGTLVASSNNSLPCDTCTYIHDGYFSIRVFNQKSDPLRYASYVAHLQAAGRSNAVREAQIAGEKAIVSANLIDIQHHGWVYELSLDVNNGTTNVTDSKLFQKIALSLHFTDLQFRN